MAARPAVVKTRHTLCGKAVLDFVSSVGVGPLE